MTQQDKKATILDPAQLIRIEAVHRGYLFQHLFAVECLLSASSLFATSVSVETDEDVEVQLEGERIYVQVKHRKGALAWDDIDGAVERFAQLRSAHESGKRAGAARFLIVSNAPPNGPLKAKLIAADWPSDVRVDWPSADPEGRILPAPHLTLLEAVEATCHLAGTLPFATLAPETLIWKLSGLVMLAATGEKRDFDHVFEVGDLPHLFEQLVLQLQDLPSPPVPYRVQEGEPSLSEAADARLIVGHSGAGKTSWLAQSAQHFPGPLVYVDVGDMPGAALANTLSREIAGKLFQQGTALGEIFLPGASGREILRLLARRLDTEGRVVTVALDNAHRPDPDDLLGVMKACPGIRFVLLARPEGDIGAIEAALGIQRQDLRGWSPDTVASAAFDEGCRGDPADYQLLIDLTGALPLFVLNALSVARSDYGGSVKQFVADLARSTHSKEVVQEIILGRVFDRLPEVVAVVADCLSFCDAPITRDEASQYVAEAGGPGPKSFLLALRHLLSRGLLQSYAGDRIKLHDSARIVGRGRVALQGEKAVSACQQALRGLIYQSLIKNWSPAKLSLFLRLTGEVGRIDVLVEMATEELFHELGVWPEVAGYLEAAIANPNIPADQRLKGLDALAFADIKLGSTRALTWLDQMDGLIAEHHLGNEEQLRVGMKRMVVLASEGNPRGVAALIATLTPLVQGMPSAHKRIFSYNVAIAETALGEADAAIGRLDRLVADYYEILGLTPREVMGKNSPQLAKMVKQGADVEDIKHLADSLDALAKAHDVAGSLAPFARIHALKFYELARAPHSLFRVGQDLADEFVGRNDFLGAKQIMETILLPQLQQWKLADFLISVRSHYAVILAYCGEFDKAERQIEQLAPYAAGLMPMQKKELHDQQNLINKLRRFGPPPQWKAPPEDVVRRFADKLMLGDSLMPHQESKLPKVGRNDRCPCGSMKKYKHCHGKRD